MCAFVCASVHAFSVGTTGGPTRGVVLRLQMMMQFREKIFFTDGSSLIPMAWARVAACGGWGVLVTAICDNQRIAVIGMFFGQGTVDSDHQFFFGANNVQIGACEIQAILAVLSWYNQT